MLIGIDVGGTKNELVLCDNSGRVLNHLLAPGSNASEFGAEAASARVADQVAELMAGRQGETVDALYAGLAGGTAPQTRRIIHDQLQMQPAFRIALSDQGLELGFVLIRNRLVLIKPDAVPRLNSILNIHFFLLSKGDLSKVTSGVVLTGVVLKVTSGVVLLPGLFDV